MGPHLSVHDLESTAARIVVVDTTSHDSHENELGAQEHAVIQEGFVGALPRARLGQSLPLGVRLDFVVSAPL